MLYFLAGVHNMRRYKDNYKKLHKRHLWKTILYRIHYIIALRRPIPL